MENIFLSGKIPDEITNNSLYNNVYVQFYVFNNESVIACGIFVCFLKLSNA